MQPGSRAATYLRALDRRQRRRRALEALSDGVWLGLMRPEDLRQVDIHFYATEQEAVEGTPRRYSDPRHIQQGLHPWETDAAAHFPAGSTLLVTSAGAGREVLGFSRLGFDVVGFEPNTSLVAAGRAVLPDPTRLERSEWDRFPEHPHTVGVVVIGWGSYMLIPSATSRRELLRRASGVLEPGGLLLVSYFVRPRTRYFEVVARTGNLVRAVRRAPPLALGDALTPNFVHYFTPTEVAADLDAAGFDVVLQHSEPYGYTIARRR